MFAKSLRVFSNGCPTTGSLGSTALRSGYFSRSLHILPVAPGSIRKSQSRFTRPVVSYPSRRWATSTTPHSTASDPAEVEALQCLEQGTQKLEEGDVQAAKALYQRSVHIKRSASSLFNLGVTHYHLKEFDDAITAWKESITLQPSSPDAHTSTYSSDRLTPLLTTHA
ncbi:hypothetical protein PHLCEN_2v4892 [Hermanssonia centrifuga]|uniref:Uncharacterized protein n=1 Tax=Hermanssonia centrifuga TaxID=98765 RepID=A0A2R6PG50_9APHY|nr:hypothetical protein PHLCEN_2v4892 [Hermanssonia centrifuga]